MLFQDLVGTYRSTWEERRFNPEFTLPPGGETVSEVAARMMEAANDIACRYPGGRILIVSHGLALATLVCIARKIPLAQVYSHILENARPEVVTWPANGCREDQGGDA